MHICFSWLAYAIETGKHGFTLFEIWKQWDTEHYLAIADRGYMAQGTLREISEISFPPFYPILIRIFSCVVSPLLAGLLIANFAYCAGAYILYRLVRMDFDSRVAVRSVIWFSVFPTAYFFHLAYTESLFIALTLGSFYCARQGKWWTAGVLGLLSGITRLQGLALVLGLGAEYVSQRGISIKRWDRRVAALGLVCGAQLGYLGMNYYLFHDPFGFTGLLQKNWGKFAAGPWTGFMEAIHRVFYNTTDPLTYAPSEVVSVLVSVALIAWMIRKVRMSYSVYSVAALLVVSSWNFWMSIPRHVLGMFPLFIALALLFKRPLSFYFATFVSMLVQLLLLSQFVQGRWVF